MSDDARAHHEAGHALLARLLGARVLCCTLEDQDDETGSTTVEWPPALDATARVEDRCSVALAGPVAELLYNGSDVERSLVQEWRADWNEAWAAASSMIESSSDRIAYLGKILRKVHRLLQDHEETLARLVDHLTAEETLLEEQIDNIVGSRWN